MEDDVGCEIEGGTEGDVVVEERHVEFLIIESKSLRESTSIVFAISIVSVISAMLHVQLINSNSYITVKSLKRYKMIN
jgi:hypothetical protein